MDLFLLRLLLSFAIGGTWVTITTEVTVRHGSRVGGVLAGFPSIVAFSLAFIAWTQSTGAAVDATTALPLALGFTAAYPLVYSALAKDRRFSVALLSSLAFWAVSAFTTTLIIIETGVGFTVSLAGFLTVWALAYISLSRRIKVRVSVRGIRIRPFDWLWRFALAGGMVVGAILLSETLGPVAGGAFASFPAIVSSTIFVVSRVDGVEASRGLATPVMFSTILTVVPYVIVARLAFPALGVLGGTLAAYAAAAPLSVFAYFLLGRMGSSGTTGDGPTTQS